jgi:predicted NBD/HSP70 family sugar kinase/biotin operon repressor
MTNVTAMTRDGALERLRVGHRRSLTVALATEGPMSRADLARATGLSRTTVSSLVGDLLAGGQVVETAERGRPHKGGSGRPSVLLRLCAPTGQVAGVDIGHGHVRAAVADRTGTVVAERIRLVDVDTRGTEAFDVAAELVRGLVAETGSADLRQVGACVPAPLDRSSARVSTRVMPGWLGLDPGEELARRLELPVVAGNDANLGALAELQHGAGRGATDLVYVKVATGLGAGIVIGGRLHRGASGNAGEIGHVQVDEHGAVCRCGSRGCLETMVAAPRLLGLLQPAYDDPLTVERVLALEGAGDAGVRRVLDDAGRTVGRALADLANCLNPGRVVVGGSLGASPALVAGVRAAIDRYAQPDAAEALDVVSGALGDRAEIVGALGLAVARVAAT